MLHLKPLAESSGYSTQLRGTASPEAQLLLLTILLTIAVLFLFAFNARVLTLATLKAHSLVILSSVASSSAISPPTQLLKILFKVSDFPLMPSTEIDS